MKFQLWRDSLKIYNETIRKAEQEVDALRVERAKFLRDTLGYAPGDVATLEGTADLVDRVFRMKEEER